MVQVFPLGANMTGIQIHVRETEGECTIYPALIFIGAHHTAAALLQLNCTSSVTQQRRLKN